MELEVRKKPSQDRQNKKKSLLQCAGDKTGLPVVEMSQVSF